MAPQAVIIHTGNLLASESFKRKVILLPAAEVVSGIELTLSAWSQCRKEYSEIIENDRLLIQNRPLIRKVDQVTRSDLKVAVKIFTYTESCVVFTDAINLLMSSLGTDYIDSLTLALPPSRKKSIDDMKSIWTCAVSNVINGSIHDLGVSDLDADQLQELYAWAEDVTPTTNQINLDACCVIPPELNEFAKQKNIRLLTHNDPRDILPKDKLTPVLESSGLPDASQYSVLWIGRYSVFITANGVIDSKGYIIALA